MFAITPDLQIIEVLATFDDYFDAETAHDAMEDMKGVAENARQALQDGTATIDERGYVVTWEGVPMTSAQHVQQLIEREEANALRRLHDGTATLNDDGHAIDENGERLAPSCTFSKYDHDDHDVCHDDHDVCNTCHDAEVAKVPALTAEQLTELLAPFDLSDDPAEPADQT